MVTAPDHSASDLGLFWKDTCQSFHLKGVYTLAPLGLDALLSGEPWQILLRKDLLSQAGGRLWHLTPSLLNLWFWLLTRTVTQTLQCARAPSTRALYSYSWEIFKIWCGAVHACAQQHVISFLSVMGLGREVRPFLDRGTCVSHWDTIRQAYQFSGLPSPVTAVAHSTQCCYCTSWALHKGFPFPDVWQFESSFVLWECGCEFMTSMLQRFFLGVFDALSFNKVLRQFCALLTHWITKKVLKAFCCLMSFVYLCWNGCALCVWAYMYSSPLG